MPNSMLCRPYMAIVFLLFRKEKECGKKNAGTMLLAHNMRIYRSAFISASISFIIISRFTGVQFLSRRKKVGIAETL